MDGSTVHITFNLVGATLILLGFLLFTAGVVFLTSRYWQRQFAHSLAPAEDNPARRQLELLLENLPDGLLLVDHEAQVIWRNPEARRLLSLSNDSFQLEQTVISMMQPVAESRQSELQEIQLTDEIKIQLRILSLAESGSPQDGVACLMRDVSERRRQEEFYRHFIHNISHELLTPLAAVQGHAAKIRAASNEEDESWWQSLAIIEREAERLTALTSNLILLSRLETEAPLHPEPTNIGALAEQAVAELLGLAQEKGIDISIQSASRLPRLQADRHRLKQVFVNLVNNAIKHCPTRTAVQVRLRGEDESIIAQVADDGPGIPPEDVPHIFEKLYRVQKEGTRATEGSGLGLSIVKQIVELHGGEVTAKSIVGEGTTFSIRLPVSRGGRS